MSAPSRWAVVLSWVLALTLGIRSASADGLDVERLTAEAWEQSGAEPYFEFRVGAAREADGAAADLARLWGLFRSETGDATVALLPADAGFAAVVATGDTWSLRGLDGPSPLELRAHRISTDDVRSFGRRLAEVSRWEVRAREGAAPPPGPYRSGSEHGGLPCVDWETRDGARRFVHVPSRPVLTAGEARDRVVYLLARGFVQYATRQTAEDPADAAVRVLADGQHLRRGVGERVLDWFACRGRVLPPGARAAIEAWAERPAMSDRDAEEERVRVARAVAAGTTGRIPLGSESWSATFRMGVAGGGPRWRTHFAEAADPTRHREALIGLLRGNYAQSVDAANAMWHFGYCSDLSGLDRLDDVHPDARGILARAMTGAGHAARGFTVLSEAVAHGAADWSADAAWWGRSGWFVGILQELRRASGTVLRDKDWRRLLETTPDPFAAMIAYGKVRSAGPGEDAESKETPRIDRKVQECIERAMAREGGEIAAAAALEYAADGGEAARAWFDSGAVAGRVARCVEVVLADPRLPPAERAAIRALNDRVRGEASRVERR